MWRYVENWARMKHALAEQVLYIQMLDIAVLSKMA